INENKWYTAEKNSASENAAIESISNELKKLFFQIEELRKEKGQQYFIYISVFKNIYSLTVVNEVEKLVSQFKEEQNILFISEFNNRISEVILKEPVPFIYERIGERYKHFLIDEFQDTSTVQWHNLLPLIDNSLAEGKFNMIVGDGKQSIYRWRGGEVEQFSSLPYVKDHFGNEFTVQREQSLISHHEFKNLASNFRSRAEVIKFNNEFFRFLSGAELGNDWKKIYDELEQKYNPENKGGYVSIDLADAEDDRENDITLEKMLEYIQLNLEKGYNYKDIAILVRTNSIGNKAADFLTRRSIPIVSSDSLLLERSAEINFLLNCLRVISNSNDLTSASGIINYLCQAGFIPGASEHELLAQLNSKTGPVKLEGLLAQHQLDLPLSSLLALPLFDCCVQLVNLFSLNKVNFIYVQFFLDEVISYTRTNSNNIHAFLEWWENRSANASVILPSGTNAVSIMTIHSSKGLEFPVVIIPYCDWIVKKTDFIWIDLEEKSLDELPVTLVKSSRDLKQTSYGSFADSEDEKQVLDNLNLLYVAMTRPVNHLHLISRIPKHHFPNVYKWLVGYLSYKNEFEKGVIHYEFGEWVNSSDEKNKNNPVFSSSTKLRYWKDIIQIKEASSTIWSHEENEERKDKGILLHYILSKIRSARDIDEAIRQSVTEGYLKHTEKEETDKLLRALIGHPSVSPFFRPGLEIRNEAELLLNNGQTLRPDRIVFEGDTVYVIDYKTGKALEKYHEQLDKYAIALNQLGHKKVKKMLIYIGELKAEEVL
ncbi:MAG: UvrD-helicase domain-containing protein, partial [Bacteroidia bacterium]